MGSEATGRADARVGRLAGKVAIVTGGGSGIGAAISRRFREEGARLVIVGRTPPATRADQSLIESGQERVVHVAGDVAGPDTGKRAACVALERFGRLDILVNNAGIDYSGVPLLDTDLEYARRVMDVNFFGAFSMLREAASVMAENHGGGESGPWGSVVNVASRAGVVAVPSMAAYGATKAALISLTRSAALELAPGIRVNAVAPGATDTPMMRAWIDDQDDPAAFERALSSTIPLGRLASPLEVANAVLFLASDEASHITGVVLPVDGGYTVG